MNLQSKRFLRTGLALLAAFVLFTWLLTRVDVKPLGVGGTDIGLSAINLFFHRLLGVRWGLYTLTDWAGLVPVAVVAGFGALGLAQWVCRGSLRRVDRDLLILGLHYIAVAAAFVLFEKLAINYRPILIGGRLEASYPSSTTLLALGVLPTLAEQLGRRCNRGAAIIKALTWAFAAFLVAGRVLSGVHWLTDILGSVLLSLGLLYIYRGLVIMVLRKP